MILKRICAGSILVLLLAASTIGAACDVSCAFASMTSDCHSGHAEANSSAASSMKMDGMDMAGMSMADMGGGHDQQEISAISQSMAHHISIGEMGPCEKQACDSSSTISARTNRSGDLHFHLIPAGAEAHFAFDAQSVFRGAREDIASFRLRNRSSLSLNLRV